MYIYNFYEPFENAEGMAALYSYRINKKIPQYLLRTRTKQTCQNQDMNMAIVL